MKIQWAMNPLKTAIVLDKNDQEILRERLKFEYLHDLEDETTVDEAVLEQWLNEAVVNYSNMLLDVHEGDCTCVPCGCCKCYAESLMEIDTIKGLGKHQASVIKLAFSTVDTIDDAIIFLENSKPVYRYNLNWPKSEWEKSVPRWLQEAQQAKLWLIEYRNEHFKSGVS